MDSPLRSPTEPLHGAGDNVVVVLHRRDSRNDLGSVGSTPLCSSSNSKTGFSCETSSEVCERHGSPQEAKNVNEVADMYRDDDRCSGPRPFTTPFILDSTSSFPQEAACSDIMLIFNQALYLHCQNLLSEAKQLYEVVSLTVHNLIQSSLSSRWLMELGMKSYNNYATIAFTCSDWTLAAVGFETALLFARQLVDCYSAYELEYASVLSNWCRCQWKQGDVSYTLYQGMAEVLRVRKALLPWDHRDVAAAYYNLATYEYNTNQTEVAVSNLLQYLEITAHRSKSSSSGKSDLDPIPALTYLLLLQNQDKEDQASRDLVRGLRALQEKRRPTRRRGPEKTEVASILNFIGTLLFHKNELGHALLFFMEELRLEEQLTECIGDISVSVTCNNIGRILQELGNLQEAVVYYKLALNDGSDSEFNKGYFQSGRLFSPSTSNLYSTVWYNLGLIHDKLGAYPDAIEAFAKSLELRKAMLGNDHPDIACLYYNIGVLQMEQQELDNAFLSFAEALRIRYHGAGNQLDDERVIRTLEKLASLYKAKGNILGAVKASREILKILESSKDCARWKSMRDSALLLRSIAELYQAGGDMRSALMAAQSSVDKFDTLGQSPYLDAVVCEERTGILYNILEQLATSLVLLGSLYHELTEPILADRVLLRAVCLLDGAIRQPLATARVITSVPCSFYVLRDVAAMLSKCHCAPEA